MRGAALGDGIGNVSRGVAEDFDIGGVMMLEDGEEVVSLGGESEERREVADAKRAVWVAGVFISRRRGRAFDVPGAPGFGLG